VGLLKDAATYLDQTIGNIKFIAILIGLLSSILDNVPLVAALQSMYSLDIYPTDHYFWEFLAYTAGTGGSVLIIGSAAGVAVMGIEKIDFFWYLKNISWVAFIGFMTGALVFILENA
jgi:Na+/H+ antiporter NhaD/arsenite permease-like protein